MRYEVSLLIATDIESAIFSCPHLAEVKRGSRNLIPDLMITCEPSAAAGGLLLNWASITGEGGCDWLHYNQYERRRRGASVSHCSHAEDDIF